MKHSPYQDWYVKNRSSILENFFSYLSIPSISTDPSHKEGVLNCAKFVADHLKEMGLEVDTWETENHPIVYGKHLKAGKDKPTVLFYVHYDVQPIDPLEEWKTDPFNPINENGVVYARGASDDKGQSFYTFEAIRAFLTLGHKEQVNIKIVVEGEEEIGSPGLTDILSKKKKELKADYLLIVDMDVPSLDHPAITLGTRGIFTLEATLKGSDIDLHSGTHGGVAYNPNRALAELLAKLHDENGKVAIDGFYDGIQTLNHSEKEKLDTSFDMKESSIDFGVHAFQAQKGHSYFETNWLLPTLEINGMSGGYTGDGFKTVIPSTANCKLSTRLVPGQDPKKIEALVVDFLKKNTKHGMKISIKCGDGAAAFRTNFDSHIVKVCKKAYEDVNQKKCGLVLSGGTIPIATELAKVSKADTVLMGYALMTDQIHAPNEHFSLECFELGFLTVARILELLAAQEKL